MAVLEETIDIAVIGAGHAGCEAALAAARMGLETVVFTVSVDSIAMMPCNPNIGGTSKGHLVKEIDALGGEMGKNIDKTFIQSKMLNQSKGPAVHSLRAQADKRAYSQSMREVLENTDHLTIRQMEIAELIVEDGVLTGVKAVSGAVYHCKAAVLCTGVYLNARCIYGDVSTYTGPNGLQAATHLTDSLKANGVEMVRFKTGTPARIDKRSIDFSKMEEQFGDERVVPFSFSTDPESVQIDQESCWLTYTNEETHKIIRENLDRSPLYSGMIEGTGPRYCPSIEDKVVKFADKNRHQVFLEPEGRYTNEMYVGGMSSSLPEDVQIAMYHTVPGLEHAKIVRNAYAIEYDCINPRQLLPSLEFKAIKNLFSGGQFNGSSGYEEAAAQGLIAGINAALCVQGKEKLVLDRSESYIGVLIDDLVTKENHEPYRMMTSRAEYRLLLRQDNADLRLRKYGYRVGLISEEQYEALKVKEQRIQELEREMEAPDFWNDPEVSQNKMKEVKSLKDDVATYAALSAQYDDIETMIEMGYEENDPELIPEIDQMMKEFVQTYEDIRMKTLLSGEYDRNNAIVSLHAGAGGTESCDWAAMLYRMYTRWADKKGFSVEVLDSLDGEEAGIKSITFQVNGENAYGYLKSEKGVHRLVRISPFNAAGKRQTSFVSCDVMPDIEEDVDVEIREEDIRIDTFRSSGAGGQHINKTSSAIRITHFPTGIVVQCQNERSQHMNKDKAMQMLKAKLYLLKQEENAAKAAGIRGEVTDIGWGNQIRSYVMQQYTMVKDHRTGVESGNVDAVMDGNIDPFINGYLKWQSLGCPKNMDSDDV